LKKILTSLLAGLVLSSPVVRSEPLTGLQCLAKAYPEFIEGIQENAVLSRSGQTYLYDTKLKEDSFQKLLDVADLKTQMSQPYPQEPLKTKPERDRDPGRLRSGKFFADMYGATASEVQQNLQRIYWEPCDCELTFSKINGAATALEAVGKQIALDPEAARYVSKPNGTFNWRRIQATSRPSVHSYAIAIDFALPAQLNAYWLWSGCRAGQACTYPDSLMTDPVMARVVRAFEAQGFIWGGKWYHFDSVHFEYRPELAGPACSGS
jgi:hypothetical protein